MKAEKESKTSWSVFDIPQKEEEIGRLRQETEKANFWDNPETASQVMKRMASLQEEVEAWFALQRRIDDALELAQLQDEGLRQELEAETELIQKELARREFQAMLSGEYDTHDALLAIHAGAGGTDSQDWAEMLMRMYLRWCERQGFSCEILDMTEGEEAGIKSVMIAVNGKYAYGYLKAEKGVHRLVRLSPFDASHRRHTSFALVEVLPQVEEDESIEIDPRDLKIDTFRSAGAGGQNVQKNDTAVRITHLPTGIVVTCQNERSQVQNRENALRVLRARLLELKREEYEEKIAELKGEFTKAEWGSQIRSYILHPYQMVKDHRTNYETGATQAVLNGYIDEFIEAFLKHSLGNGVPSPK